MPESEDRSEDRPETAAPLDANASKAAAAARMHDQTKWVDLQVQQAIMRGEFDGIAGLEDLLAFFGKLPNKDKEFAMIPSIAHATFTQKNFLMAYHTLHSFLTRPAPAHLF
jgi:alpha-beta hydrolase superfamily lysophospholipase